MSEIERQLNERSSERGQITALTESFTDRLRPLFEEYEQAVIRRVPLAKLTLIDRTQRPHRPQRRGWLASILDGPRVEPPTKHVHAWQLVQWSSDTPALDPLLDTSGSIVGIHRVAEGRYLKLLGGDHWKSDGPTVVDTGTEFWPLIIRAVRSHVAKGLSGKHPNEVQHDFPALYETLQNQMTNVIDRRSRAYHTPSLVTDGVTLDHYAV